MSAPLAGKFQDHYEVLGVEPNAELETIQMAYTRLAQELHPNQPETGDANPLKRDRRAHARTAPFSQRTKASTAAGTSAPFAAASAIT